jgi:hypothetical protein
MVLTKSQHHKGEKMMRDETLVENVMMLEEGYPRLGFKAFSSLISDGVAGVCVTRLHPEYVKEKFSLTTPKFYWLTGNAYESAISPKSLGPLVKVIKQEAKGREIVVFLDGLEYLLLWNDMKKVMTSLIEIGRVLKANGGMLYVSIDPLAMGDVPPYPILAGAQRTSSANRLSRANGRGSSSLGSKGTKRIERVSMTTSFSSSNMMLT